MQVVHVPKSDARLANNDLPLDIQRLRCRSLYHALRFTPPIENLGKVRLLAYPTEFASLYRVSFNIWGAPRCRSLFRSLGMGHKARHEPKWSDFIIWGHYMHNMWNGKISPIKYESLSPIITYAYILLLLYTISCCQTVGMCVSI